MCESGHKNSVLQGHRVEAFALAANVNANYRSSYAIHCEASAYPAPRAACHSAHASAAENARKHIPRQITLAYLSVDYDTGKATAHSQSLFAPRGHAG